MSQTTAHLAKRELDLSLSLNVLPPVYFTQSICHVYRPIQYYGVQNVLLLQCV